MRQPTFTFSCGEYKRTRPLLDGRVQPKGFRLKVISDPFPEREMLGDYQHIRNQRMVMDKAYDICEMGMAPYLSARVEGVPLIAIPVFHYRRFRHGYIFCREDAGIQRPQDLIGRRVGVRRLNLTAGVWARALLEHEYGVPLDRIVWVVSVDVPLRPKVRDRLVIEPAPSNLTLESLLMRGELDAMIEASNVSGLAQGNRRIRRLLGEDTRELEIDYYRRTRIFPIMHTVVLWTELLGEFPDLPQQLHRGFLEAKEKGAQDRDLPLRYILAEEERQWWNSLTDAQRQTLQRDGDPWIYSVREDRETVETFLDYAYEQGLTLNRSEIEDLFAPTTLSL